MVKRCYTRPSGLPVLVSKNHPPIHGYAVLINQIDFSIGIYPPGLVTQRVYKVNLDPLPGIQARQREVNISPSYGFGGIPVEH